MRRIGSRPSATYARTWARFPSCASSGGGERAFRGQTGGLIAAVPRAGRCAGLLLLCVERFVAYMYSFRAASEITYCVFCKEFRRTKSPKLTAKYPCSQEGAGVIEQHVFCRYCRRVAAAWLHLKPESSSHPPLAQLAPPLHLRGTLVCDACSMRRSSTRGSTLLYIVMHRIRAPARV